VSRTLKHTLPEKQPPAGRQTGAALLLTLLILVLLATGVLLKRLNSAASVPTVRSAETATSLAEAKAALIAWAVTHPGTPGMLPYPDGNADAEGYDGLADCAAAGPGNPALLLGRLPGGGEDSAFSACGVVVTWRMGAPVGDAEGEPLWYAVSGNLLRNSGVPINSGLLDDSNPSFPWITVRDRNGVIISNQVAAVIIAPGRPLGAVPRVGGGPIDQSGREVAAPGVEQFLDGIDVGGTVFANADADGCADNDIGCGGVSGEDFIMSPDSRFTPDDSDNFNDHLIYITVEELLRATEKRVLGEVSVMLENYRTTHGHYPWLSPFRPPPPTVTSVGVAVAPIGYTTLTDDEAAFVTKGVAPGDLIQNPDTGLFGTIFTVGSETQLTIADPLPVADGDPYVLIFTGTAGAGSTDESLVDAGADYVAAGIRPGDQIRKTPATPNGDAVVVSVVDANNLVIRAFESFAGSTYQIGPAAFDAVIGTREGHIPFTNTTVAPVEGYTFATGFTVNTWTNGTAPAGPWVDVLTTAYPLADWHDNNDTRTEAAVLAALVRPNDAPPLVVPPQNGVCTWTGVAGRVECRGFVELDIDLTNTDITSAGPYYPYIPYTGILYSPGDEDSLLGIHGQPGIGGGHWDNGWLPTGEDIGSESWITIVRRRFTFELDYAGNPTTVSVNSVKARNVIGTLPVAGPDYVTIMVEDSVQFPDLAWRVIASATLDATAGTNAVFNTGIYYALRDDTELPAWFSVNEWSTYVYAKLSADHVSGGADDCVANANCLSLDVQGTLGVRTDARAVLVGAGPALTGQDRARGDDCDSNPATPPDFMCTFFESANDTAGNNTAERNTPTVGFNDQVRVVSPLPP